MFKLLLLVAAVLGASHCLTMQHTEYYELFYDSKFISVKIDNNKISFVGCNKNTGTTETNGISFKVTSWDQTEK